ncbi:MAG: hypothetical protein WBF55_10470, partial [Syntrophobacteria bacterium]
VDVSTADPKISQFGLDDTLTGLDGDRPSDFGSRVTSSFSICNHVLSPPQYGKSSSRQSMVIQPKFILKRSTDSTSFTTPALSEQSFCSAVVPLPAKNQKRGHPLGFERWSGWNPRFA